MKVAVLLATLLGKGGFAFPPHATLAEMGGMHKRHVARAIKGLLARGIIAIADPGTPSRAARYTLDADAILALLGTSMGGAEAPPQVARPRLYGRLGGTSTGGAAPPPGAPEGQRSASEAQAKLQTKLSASRGALAPSPEARARRSARRGPDQVKGAKPRNAWRHSFGAEASGDGQ